MINEKNVLCIYHGNCVDGFGAAWAVRKYFGDIEFYPGVYQEDPPDVTGKYVVIVDFSYTPEVLEKMLESCYGILLIDHHKSAVERVMTYEWKGKLVDMSNWSKNIDIDRYKENLMIDGCENSPSRIYTVFDMDRSGAMMAWNFFHPEQRAPELIEHIQDRDLWKFHLKGTREIQAALFSYPYDFELWDDLMWRITALKQDGEAIERKHFKDVNELIERASHRMTIAGHDVPALNAPYFYSSDVGHIMSRGEKFAVCYWNEKGKTVFSLRSNDNGLDVSEIAKMFGGGGHRNASGFSINVVTNLII